MTPGEDRRAPRRGTGRTHGTASAASLLWTLVQLRLAVLLGLVAFAAPAAARTVTIVDKPHGLVSGVLAVPVVATDPVERVALFINGVKHTEARGRTMTARVDVGYYIRRLRLRAVGYDADGNEAGDDEMVVNDPRPPFRVRLQAPREWPAEGTVELHATLLRPVEIGLVGVDFFVGEERVATDGVPPYSASVDAARFDAPVYARAVARSGTGQEANDVVVFGDRMREQLDVTVQQIPLSVSAGSAPLALGDLVLYENGAPRPVDALVPAEELPLRVILLIDYSESMLRELDVVKAAARQFAQRLLRPQDRLAVVGFNQRTFWLTGWSNDWTAVAGAVDRVRPIGETHLYDSVIEMLYELQKSQARHALVVLTDGADQGSRYKLGHLIHYARYAGVPVYPVVKNTALSKWMRLGVGRVQARRLTNIAEETGATWFIIRSERELDGVYERIAAELRRQYRLVFQSDGGGADQWRSLRVESKAGHRLRIPRGYFP